MARNGQARVPTMHANDMPTRGELKDVLIDGIPAWAIGGKWRAIDPCGVHIINGAVEPNRVVQLNAVRDAVAVGVGKALVDLTVAIVVFPIAQFRREGRLFGRFFRRFIGGIFWGFDWGSLWAGCRRRFVGRRFMG